ncbi:hypothetical protein GY45DRAFT_1340857 [Cubamyces sp. BRFM 1775]|nr:hypothetical protein GY45DRAFT_1340857 [Cubamyces sp. BRFM 1775]
MPVPTDPRVKDVVDTRLASERVQWKRFLRPCTAGGSHMVSSSYGNSTWDHVGQIFEISGKCLADTRCKLHSVPLEAQMTKSTRHAMLSDLISLNPPPYGKEIHRASAIMMRAIIADEMELEQTQGHSTLGAPRTAGSLWASTCSSSAGEASDGSRPSTPSGLSQTSSRRSSVCSERGAVGRPANPTCEVIVYAYAPGPNKPMVIRAVGTPRDNVVEFTFSQPKVYDALGIDAASRKKPTYKVWSRSIGDWASYPKAHHPLFLAPEERVLYREEYVYHLPDLEYIKSQLTSQDRLLAAKPAGLPLPAVFASVSAGSTSSMHPAIQASPPLPVSDSFDVELALHHPVPVPKKGQKRARTSNSQPSHKRSKASLSSRRTQTARGQASEAVNDMYDGEGTSKGASKAKPGPKGKQVEIIVISDSE